MSEVQRKLATVEAVQSCVKHPNADKLNIVTVRGWQCITTEKYDEGDLCVYFEIDSFLPIHPRFEFLRKPCYKTVEGLGEGFRLKTIRLRGSLSQGLVLPLSEFSNIENPKAGDDVTELLEVRKYEKPIPVHLSGKIRGNFPWFIPKTDQERIQNRWSDLQSIPKFYEDTYEVTIKLDGSSMTAYLHEDKFGVCSRNLDLEETEGNAFWKVARAYKIEEYLRELGRNLAIQGELMGPNVQGNRENFSDYRFFVFDVYDIDAQRYLSPDERGSLFALSDIVHVPFLEHKKLSDFKSLEEILAYASGPSINAKSREGVVFKSLTQPNNTFKVISNEYLLEEKD